MSDKYNEELMEIINIIEHQGDIVYAIREGYIKSKDIQHKELAALVEQIENLKPVFESIDQILSKHY